MVVTLDASMSPEEFDAWVDKFEEGHKGALNAYKTIFLAGGADAKVVGADLQQIEFKVTQAHGETRICNAAGIPPIIVGDQRGARLGHVQQLRAGAPRVGGREAAPDVGRRLRDARAR